MSLTLSLRTVIAALSATLAVALVVVGALQGHGEEPDAPAPAAREPAAESAGGHPYIRPARLDGLETFSCAGCHATIAEEWSASAHGLSWVDERYQAALATRRRPESCHGCHIPEPLHGSAERLGGKPLPRTEESEPRRFGVSCKTCHLDADGGILGPWGAEQEAHRSVRSTSFLADGTNQLCLGCHRTTVGPVIGIAKDFEVANLASEGETCVGCHMAEVERPMATDDDDQPTRVRQGRSHALRGPNDPEFMASAFVLSAVLEPERAVVSVLNGAGHRIPGLVDRVIVLRAELQDAGGAVVGSATLTFDTVAHLRVRESVELVVPGRGGVRVRVVGEHRPPDGPPQTFLETWLPE